MPKNYREQGDAACRYAREQIREGSTQLINNEYDLNKKRALQKALRDVRREVDKSKFLIKIDDSIRPHISHQAIEDSRIKLHQFFKPIILLWQPLPLEQHS